MAGSTRPSTKSITNIPLHLALLLNTLTQLKLFSLVNYFVTLLYNVDLTFYNVGIGTGLGPILVGFISGTHLFTIWLWVSLRLWQTIDVHSGYNFPWSANNLIPFWGGNTFNIVDIYSYYSGADFHDYHHMAFVGNYASTFTYCDKIFGTDDKFWAWKKKGGAKQQ